jgi:hypothetical protein
MPHWAAVSFASTWPPAGSQHSRRGCHTRAASQQSSLSRRRINTLDVDSMIMLSPQRTRYKVGKLFADVKATVP